MIVVCDFCRDITDDEDSHLVEDMLVCGHCILLVDMLKEFMKRGGTKEVWNIRQDGQMMMPI